VASSNIDRFSRMVNNLYTRAFEKDAQKFNTLFNKTSNLLDTSLDAHGLRSLSSLIMRDLPISYTHLDTLIPAGTPAYNLPIKDRIDTVNSWYAADATKLTRVASLLGGNLQDYAYQFAATYMNKADAAEYDVTSWTCEALVKFTSTATMKLVGQGTTATGWGMWLTNKKLTLVSALDSVNTSNGADLNDGLVHHVAVTRNAGNTLKWFVDGVEVASSTITNVSTTALSGSLEIGSSANPFTGTIDEVATYNYALTPTQIAEHYATINVVTAAATNSVGNVGWYVPPLSRAYADMTASGSDQSTEPSAYGFSGTVNLQYPAAMFLGNPGWGWLVVRIRPTWSNTAGVLHPIFTHNDADRTFELVYKATNVWALRIGNPGVSVGEVTIAATHIANQDITLAAQWVGSGSGIKLSLDGAAFVSGTSQSPGAGPTNFMFGYDGANSLAGAIHWAVMGGLAATDEQLSDADVAVYHAHGNRDPIWDTIPNIRTTKPAFLWDGRTNAHTSLAVFGE